MSGTVLAMWRRARITILMASVVVIASGAWAGGASAGLKLKAPLHVRSVNDVSVNWAGYITPAADVTSVSGEWTVPDAGMLPPGVASTWVGIGGYTTSDLIQAGTIQDATPLAGIIDGGNYAAWYEMLPDSPAYITGCAGDANCTVGRGDLMQTTIAVQGG